MHLSKHHGLGNDFLVALEELNGGELRLDGNDAARLCDRVRGIGADGLLLGLLPDPAEECDTVMVLYNSDGSRAEMSGNGIRCLAQAVAHARGLVEGSIRVATDAGPRVLDISPGTRAGEVVVDVGMGEPRPGPVPSVAATRRLGDHRYATVDMGNPHLVVLVGDLAGVDVAGDGSLFEQQFEGGINTEFIALDGHGGLDMRVWERGAGVTQACGTGACAAAVAAHGWDLVGDEVNVAMPGGTATVVMGAPGGVHLIGPAAHIADIEAR